MLTIIVIESRPLICRGIEHLISETVPDCQVDVASLRDPEKIDESNETPPLRSSYTLMLLSLALLDHAAAKTIATVTHTYRPKFILLLTDCLAILPAGLPSNVIGCIPIHAHLEILRAAIILALADEVSSLGALSVKEPFLAPDSVMKSLSEKASDTTIPTFPMSRWAQQESKILGLTPRQYEVLVLLARGYTLKVIAHHLNIAAATAKVHAETVYQRLHVHNRTEAVYAAISRGATLGWPSIVREMKTYTRVGSLTAIDPSG